VDPGREDLLLGRLGRLDDRHGRRPPDDDLVHDEQHGLGIVGSDWSAQYGQAIYDAVTS